MIMKMIDVLNMVAEGKIEKDTKLIVSDGFGEYEYKYKQQKGYRAFYNNFDKISKMRIDNEFRLDEDFLNLEVKLIPPKPKKYQLKLYEDDDVSYVTRNPYDNIFSYYVSDKNETCNFITKFTQEEIDNEKLLKFVEQHGIKEEVKE